MLARIFYHNARYFILAALVILMVGAGSISSIARQEDPTITNFVATVTTFFPGAEPGRVEAQISRPLEDVIRRIPEVDEVQSTSNTGVSLIQVKLYDHYSKAEIERIWPEVRSAVSGARLPESAHSPYFDKDKMSTYVQIFALRAAAGVDLPNSILNRIANDFADSSRNFPGTKLVDVFGETEEEIRIAIDENGLIARGITMDEVAAALQAADPKMASGRVIGNGTDMLIEIAGELNSMERIRQVIVRALPDGRAVRIADIGRVFKTEVSPPASMALAEGEHAILIGVSMREGLQVDKWSKDFSTYADQYRQNMPAGIVLDNTYDQSGYTVERLTSVALNLAMGIVLVLLVLLVTLGWRAAIVVAIILPLCSLMSISLLHYLDVPIHQMSLTGLVVALGLLVDGSIVMTDDIRKQLLAGDSGLDAINHAVGKLRVPLLSSTATTILAFMPMVILPGVAGDFLGSIATAVVVMLGSSLLLALVITPVLAAWLLPGGLQLDKGRWWVSGLASGRMGNALTRALDWSLAHPIASIALALALPLAGFFAFGTLTAQFFPSADRDQLYVQVKLPDGRSIYDTHALALEIDQHIRAHPMVRRVDWTLGESPPAFYYNMLRSHEGEPSWAEALVLTHDKDQTDDLIRQLQGEMDRQYPQARIVVRGIDQGPPVNAPVEVEIFGPNLEVLRALGEEFRLRMERIANVTHTNTSLVAGAPKVVFTIDQNKLRLANLQLSDVAGTLEGALQGRTGGEVLEGTERLPIRAKLKESDWVSAEQIASMRLPINSRGQQQQPGISLNSLGHFELKPSRSPITRKNGERLNTVQAFIKRGILPEEALKELQADLAANPIELPATYRYSFGGNSDERASMVDKIMAPMGMIVAMLIATIVLTFNSWRLAVIALLVCICSMGLSLLALAIFRYPFGVQALIGVIGSIGVSINAAIIIMTALQHDEQAMLGKTHAVREVVMGSSRHITSTTITTFGGFLPLILAGGGFWPPFAMAIAGGVLLSTVISFFMVPPMFMLATSFGREPVDTPLRLTRSTTFPVKKLAS
ncbi:MAG: efflux RND transporter permease subunit [Halioglobus sp.]